MSAPLLSIITITRYRDSSSIDTLASAKFLRDSFPVEHVMVDGSGSNSPLPVDFPDVRLVARVAHGISDAFNAGIRSSSGEWIWFLNGGDYIDPRLDPKFLNVLLSSTDADVIIGSTTYAGESKSKPHLPPKMQWPSIHSWIPHPSTLIRRKLFTRYGYFDERFSIAMDYEWWLRALSNDVSVDILAVPFAVFSSGGVSSVKESEYKIRTELNMAVRRHRKIILRSWLGQSKRALGALGRALLS